MTRQRVERRSQPAPAVPAADTPAAIVRRGLLIQQRTGTVSAIEYLKANAIDARVIQRVLSGQAVRDEDAAALGLVEDELAL